MSAREYLEKANRYQVKPEELFQYFSQHVLQVTVVYQTSSLGKKPLLARSNRPKVKYIVAFTDQEAAKMVRVRQPEFLEMTEEPTLEFLLKAYRSSAEGLMFNPGLDSRFFVARPQLLDWIRFYCIHKFSKQSSVWVIKNGSSILKGAYQPGFSTIVIYTGKEEAIKSAMQSGGQATEVSWTDIFHFLERISTKTIYVNYGLPEAFLLNAHQMDQIRHGAQKGYVEQTTSSHKFIPELSNLDETNPAKEIQETAVSISIDSDTISQEEADDWETVLASEDEPLTATRDIQQTSAYTPVAPIVEENVTVGEKTIIPKESAVEEKTVTPEESAVEEKTVTSEESTVEEKIVTSKEPAVETKIAKPTLSNDDFSNPWGEDDDGFSQQIPKTSFLFQSKPTVEQTSTQDDAEPEVQPKQQEVQEVTPSNPATNGVPTDVQHGLSVLEAAIDAGHGMANGWEVCRALAALRRIWVIVDMERKMVILASQDEQRIADFFTSEESAKALIEEAHSRNASLPQMVPRLISTKKLFRSLAPMQCALWINRGSANAWTSVMGDTLPYVLQLMAQK